MRLAYGARTAIVLVFIALLSVGFFWCMFKPVGPKPSAGDALLARAMAYARRGDEGAAFFRRALDGFENVVIRHPRSRQAQIALLEKARFQARHGMLQGALADYRRIPALWPGRRVEIDAALEEACLLDKRLNDPVAAAAIRSALFHRMLGVAEGGATGGAPRGAEETAADQAALLLVSVELTDHHSRNGRWQQAADVLERLLAVRPDIPLWDHLSFRLAEVHRERLKNKVRAVTLYRRIAQDASSPWGNLATERLTALGETP